MTDTAYETGMIAEREWSHPASAVIQVPNPAVATGFTYTCPGTMEQIVQVVKFRLVTDDNVAARIAVVSYLDYDGAVFAQVASPFTQAASLTTDYSFAVGVQQYGANDAASIGAGLPPIKLDDGLSVSVSVTGVQAGDQVSVVRLAVLQWPVRAPWRS